MSFCWGTMPGFFPCSLFAASHLEVRRRAINGPVSPSLPWKIKHSSDISSYPQVVPLQPCTPSVFPPKPTIGLGCKALSKAKEVKISKNVLTQGSECIYIRWASAQLPPQLVLYAHIFQQ